MRILFANSTVNWGGEKSWALDTARCSAQSGHTCAMVGRKGDRWVEACAEAGLESHGMRFGPTILDPWDLRHFHAVARAFAPDCIVVNLARDMCAGAYAGWRLGVPVVRHAGLANDINGDPVERLLHHHAFAGTIAVGHDMKREMIALRPWMNPDRIHVIHIGKDTKSFCPERSSDLRREWRLGADAFLLGVTSQIEEKKGHRFLFDAVAQLVASGLDVHLAVVGRGSHTAALKIRVAELRLLDRVHFLGFRRDLPRLLQNMDGFALPSLSEAFPNTLVEAMATGLPCVATRISCVPEIVDEGRNALLVPAGDVPSLMAAIESLASDEALRRRLGEAARRTVEERFGLEQTTTAFLDYLCRFVPESKMSVGHSGL